MTRREGPARHSALIARYSSLVTRYLLHPEPRFVLARVPFWCLLNKMNLLTLCSVHIMIVPPSGVRSSIALAPQLNLQCRRPHIAGDCGSLRPDWVRLQLRSAYALRPNAAVRRGTGRICCSCRSPSPFDWFAKTQGGVHEASTGGAISLSHKSARGNSGHGRRRVGDRWSVEELICRHI